MAWLIKCFIGSTKLHVESFISYPFTKFTSSPFCVRRLKAIIPRSRRFWSTAALAFWLFPAPSMSASYEIVITNGRVMDPDTNFDEVRNIGIRDGRIEAISTDVLSGEEFIDAEGLVVSPGFIDLHVHGVDNITGRLQAADGVTTTLELELGVYPVATWYDERENRSMLNYGASVSHALVRAQAKYDEVNGDKPHSVVTELPDRPSAWADDVATMDELKAMNYYLGEELAQGALGIGYGISYTPAATRGEIYRGFKIASEHGVPVFTHVRSICCMESEGPIASFQEVISNAAATGASVHIAHIGSSGKKFAPIILEMLDGAVERGLDITTEIYPYTAAQTEIGSAIFDSGWQSRVGVDYEDLEWATTGERLTEKSFSEYRKQFPRGSVVAHVIPELAVEAALQHPSVIIVSDAPVYADGDGHPRGSGTFSRVLGHYVRERQSLGLMDALRKMTILPAKRLEAAVPQMRTKGRLQTGADADIVIFDARTIIDEATYENPTQPSKGVVHLIVGGTPILRDGKIIEDTFPGAAIRRNSKR